MPPVGMYGSAATILRGLLYNFGGNPSYHSVLWFDLSQYGGDWKTMNIPLDSFLNHYARDATVVKDRIVYFGSHNIDVTFVLGTEAGSEQLRVESRL